MTVLTPSYDWGRKYFPDAKIILDIIHALDYLWPAVHAFEKEGTAKAQATVCYWLTLILSGKVGYGHRRASSKDYQDWQ